MSENGPGPSDFETVEERRARISSQVRRWCEQARIEGRHPMLSDEAAVWIAAGHLDASSRQILTNRRRVGRGIPSIGGYGNLRLLTEEHAQIQRKADALRPGPTQLVVKYRVAELGKKLKSLHSSVVMSTAHYGSGVRAMRRDRRDGVHLDLDQREALFRALQYTPTPTPVGRLTEVGNYALGSAAQRLLEMSDKTAAAGAGRRVADALGRGIESDDDRFVDGYDTLLFVAGMLYDRINGSAAWHSEHFIIQRTQLDLAEELTHIAVDTVALREITGELANALRVAHGDAGIGQIRARQQALRPVWDQLVDRVAALARIGDLLAQAEVQLRSVMAVQHSMSLDNRIDELIARSGDRELSAENTHYVGDQFGGVEQLIGTYQSALFGDIAELTAWSDSAR